MSIRMQELASTDFSDAIARGRMCIRGSAFAAKPPVNA